MTTQTGIEKGPSANGSTDTLAPGETTAVRPKPKRSTELRLALAAALNPLGKAIVLLQQEIGLNPVLERPLAELRLVRQTVGFDEQVRLIRRHICLVRDILDKGTGAEIISLLKAAAAELRVRGSPRAFWSSVATAIVSFERLVDSKDNHVLLPILTKLYALVDTHPSAESAAVFRKATIAFRWLEEGNGDVSKGLELLRIAELELRWILDEEKDLRAAAAHEDASEEMSGTPP